MALPENTLRRLAFDYVRLWHQANDSLGTKLLELLFPYMQQVLATPAVRSHETGTELMNSFRKAMMHDAPGIVQSVAPKDITGVAASIHSQLQLVRQWLPVARKIELLSPVEMESFVKFVLYYYLVREPGANQLSVIDHLLKVKPHSPINT